MRLHGVAGVGGVPMLRDLCGAQLDDVGGAAIVHSLCRLTSRHTVHLRAATAALCLALAAAAAAAPVAGLLSTPTGVVPALTLHAWSVTGAQLYSVTTQAGQTSFTLDLPRGRYWLFATPADPGAPPIYGAYTGFAACGRAADPRASDCQSHALRVLAVGAAGQVGIGLSDWRLDDAVTRDLDRILGRSDGGAVEEAQLAAPKFSEYPAPAYTGPRAAALAAGGDARLERDREPLATALASAPNFAGRMVLLRLGCGSGCEQVALVDLASGRVAYPPALADLPPSTTCSSRGPLVFRRDSRLVTVTGRDKTELVTRYYVWDPDSGLLRLVASLASTLDERCVPRG
jgi:hypothetical protein